MILQVLCVNQQMPLIKAICHQRIDLEKVLGSACFGNFDQMFFEQSFEFLSDV